MTVAEARRAAAVVAAMLMAAAFAGGDAARAQSSAPVATLVLTPATIDESGAMNSTAVAATLDKASTAATTIEVSAAPVSPATSGDYTLSSTTTLTIAAGQTASTGTVTITAVDNGAASADKQVTVTGAAANSAGVTGPAAATLTIADDELTEVTVLVAYTDGARAAAGGTQEMTDAIDLKVAAANTALTDSGVRVRFRLAHAVEVDYDRATRVRHDLDRLERTWDGHLDGIHELRDRYQADLVTLLVRPRRGAGGIARVMQKVGTAFAAYAFSVVTDGTAATFAHELGHNMGLVHDRYVSDLSWTLSYSYSFGYVNKEAFKAGAPASARWRTIMSYDRRCSDAGFGCTELNRFSNPDQSHLGDAIGVPASSTETGADGPADARSTLNNVRRVVASFRRPCTSGFTLATPVQYVPLAGGTTWFEVDGAGAAGCVWEAAVAAGSEFLTISSERHAAGRGLVEVAVPASASERTGTLTVGGLTATVRQVAAPPGFCARTPQMISAIMRELSGVASCAAVTASHLASITSLGLQDRRIGRLRTGDFDGLTAVTSIDLRSNGLTALPEGLFAGLSGLRSLRLEGNPGAPFALELTPALSGVPGAASRVAVALPLGAPFPMQVELEADGGALSPAAAGLGRGATESAAVALTHSSNDPALVSIAAPPPVPSGYTGVTTRAGPPLAVCSASRCPADLSFGAAAWTTAGGGSVTVTATLSETFGRKVVVPVEATSSVAGTSRFTAADSVTFAAGENVAALTVSAAASGDDAETLTLGFGDLPWLVKRAHPTAAATVSIDDAAPAQSLPPTVRIGSDAPFPATGPFTVTFTFSESVLGFGASGIEVVNGAGSNFQGGGAAYSLTVTPGAGLVDVVTVRLPAGAARNAAGTDSAGQTASFAINTLPGICSRTSQVISEILRQLPGVAKCADVTAAHLASIASLHLGGKSIGTLRHHDFAGLGSVSGVDLLGNSQLAALPGRLFADTKNLTDLYLSGNSLATLPADLFDGLARLDTLLLNGGSLPGLPDGLFSGLSALRTLWLHGHPGAPFALDLELASSSAPGATPGSRDIAVLLPAGAPFPMQVGLAVDGGTLSADAAGLGSGATESAPVTLTHASNDPALVSIAAPPPVPADSCRVEIAANNVQHGLCYSGITTGAGPPLAVCSDSRCPADVTFGVPGFFSSELHDRGTAIYRLREDGAVTVQVALSEAFDRKVVIPIEATSSTAGSSRFSVAGDSVTFEPGQNIANLTVSAAAGADDRETLALRFGDLPWLVKRAHPRAAATVRIDNAWSARDLPPSVRIGSDASYPATGPFTVTFTFSETVLGFEARDVGIVNGAGSNFGGSGADYLLTVTPKAGFVGAVTVRLPAGVARNAAGAGNAERTASFAVAAGDRDADDGGGPGPGGGGGGGGGGAPPPDDDQDGGGDGSDGSGSGGGGPPRAAIATSAECADGLCRARTGAALRFQDASSGTVRMRLWDFGDGRQSRSGSLSHAWTEPGFYRATLWTGDGGSESTAALTFLVEAAEPAGTCEPDVETRCLGDSRYAVTVDWRTADGGGGPALVVRSGTNDAGLFAFFDPANWEVLVKVLDGCAVNGHAWVFVASTTDLGYTIRIADTATGAVREYGNEPGASPPAVTDVTAFAASCEP